VNTSEYVTREIVYILVSNTDRLILYKVVGCFPRESRGLWEVPGIPVKVDAHIMYYIVGRLPPYYYA